MAHTESVVLKTARATQRRVRQPETELNATVNAICIQPTLGSDTLDLPELRPLIGQRVEIIVLAETPPVSGIATETLETFFARRSVEPLLSAEQRAVMLTDPRFEKLWPILRGDPECIDVEANIANRAASME
jgi:hypothetical protein